MKIEWIKSVRSIVTLMITITFCWLSHKGKISTEAFMAVMGSVLTYYFTGKKRKENSNENISTGSSN